MRNLNLALNCFILIFCINACQPESPKVHYPTPHPNEKPSVFLPGIVSSGSDSLDFNAAFALDGKTFYFSRSIKGKYTIMESVFNGKEWQQPVTSQLFDTSFSNTDPFFSTDGSLYFISNRPKDGNDSIDDYDIYVMRKLNENWKDPERLTINSDSTEYYVSVSHTGNLYFASYRDGNLDLYMSLNKGGQYEKPLLLTALNSLADEHDPLIAPDESYIIFNSSREGGFGQADLYISHRLNGQWQTPINMGAAINTTSYEYCPNFGPDQKYLFYSSEYDVKWISANILNSYQ
ncbi:TolB family protein [Fulvivirga ligni]|uniref:TolB family protein n=1 Tax=Fulvivirga ligni TaxID=2904246 RepID=UPI001F28302A|nr:hypothetical protein [Fulvivirga ligni]UII20545.1 hypothetical protein LVD16_22145 [Fulvivirga ligni]